MFLVIILATVLASVVAHMYVMRKNAVSKDESYYAANRNESRYLAGRAVMKTVTVGMAALVVWMLITFFALSHPKVTETAALAQSPGSDYVTTTGYYVNGEDGIVELREIGIGKQVRYIPADSNYYEVKSDVTPAWAWFLFTDLKKTTGYDFYLTD